MNELLSTDGQDFFT
ncbi:hypothetical protein Ccrd_026881 [Cynara cardunculus var. scolymus]|nr:hypothetical protein Ccrd_026881 [Cynara cardunculus var. scolymus]